MFFPAFVDTKKINFLVVGGGSVALAKLITLAESGASVTIVSKQITPEVRTLAKKNNYVLLQEAYVASHLAFGDCIVAATNQQSVNEGIYTDCIKAGKLVNVVDNKRLCTFIFPALVRRGDVTIAISSAGVSPVLTHFIKHAIQRTVPEGIGRLNGLVKQHTQLVKRCLPKLQPRRLFWQNFFDSHAADLACAGDVQQSEQLLLRQLAGTDKTVRACVYFIGAGPGDPELLTLKAMRLLSRADIVLHDRLVSPEIITHARKDAHIVYVGKARHTHPVPQQTISQMLVDYASKGKIVARLKGGDTTVFAHLAHEIDAVSAAHIAFQIVPGISAASGAAAALGFPLTSRSQEQSFRVLTYYSNKPQPVSFWRNLVESNDFLLFYMSAQQGSIITQMLLAADKDAATPVVVIEQATTPYQKYYQTTLERFSEQYGETHFASPSLLCIGYNLRWIERHRWCHSTQQGVYFPSVEDTTVTHLPASVGDQLVSRLA